MYGKCNSHLNYDCLKVARAVMASVHTYTAVKHRFVTVCSLRVAIIQHAGLHAAIQTINKVCRICMKQLLMQLQLIYTIQHIITSQQ